MTDFSKIKQQLEILWQTVEKLETESGGGSGGTSDYTELTNKPSINSIELNGNKTLTQLGIASASALNTLISQFDDLFAVDNVSVVSDGEYPTSIDSRLALHQPINLNNVNYYFFEESGVDYSYFAIDTSGAYPMISLAQLFKENHRVKFYNTAVDTAPTSASDNLITSGAVYTALQNLPSGGLETIELTKNLNYSYWPEDKMSVLDNYNQFVYLKFSGSTTANLCFIVHDPNSPNAKVGFVLVPMAYSNGGTHLAYYGFSVNTSTRQLTLGSQVDNVDTNNILTSFYNPIGTAINANTNLDGSIACTKYYCTAANAATLTNCPTTDAFVLTVEHTTNVAANTLLQKIITVGTTPTVYMRTKSGSSAWNSWYKFEGTVVS